MGDGGLYEGRRSREGRDGEVKLGRGSVRCWGEQDVSAVIIGPRHVGCAGKKGASAATKQSFCEAATAFL